MTKRGNKVFISADIEGVTGVIHWNDTDQKSKGDYEYFRKVMTGEVNAAVEAALEAGYTDIVVRDAHGSGLNILPMELNENARLIREWADSPFMMMDGLDESFDAVIFIGYHAKANTPNATLKHTMNTRVADVTINDVSLAEAGINALIAGHFNVPVVFIAGDKAICDYSRELWPGMETVAVKEGLGSACINLHPKKSNELIKIGVGAGLRKRKSIPPYRLEPPLTCVITYKDELAANHSQWFPNTDRISPVTVRFQSDSFMECLKFFFFCLM